MQLTGPGVWGEVKAARQIAEIVSVQNLYNLQHRDAEELLDWSEEQGIGFIPWFPLATGGLTGPDSLLTDIAERKNATPAQIALAWLLKRSPVMLPIPGTSSVAHLEDNLQGATIELTDDEFAELSSLGG
ncbi:aryl-alcohol dehydrogenase-like predicted oxidoreductase [Microbacterium marinum]|uniref:Aryl-alcohol dehydrogenase-like predicted oxidoreductase n=1 Tax=Microbacterium marinum TaxID=421115 RepID=A0A7W7BS43_9MICO|nr:aldo/keto reductase [Microbacterium marinum]MBB4666618.1 aryl-alcohol dehydrogenase-like predicted oxidoreductase [Microbacterium marinum]